MFTINFSRCAFCKSVLCSKKRKERNHLYVNILFVTVSSYSKQHNRTRADSSPDAIAFRRRRAGNRERGATGPEHHWHRAPTKEGPGDEAGTRGHKVPCPPTCWEEGGPEENSVRPTGQIIYLENYQLKVHCERAGKPC